MYEINFNHYFYLYEPSFLSVEAIESDTKALETDIFAVHREVAG